jgi:hypothetical protein
MAKKSSFENEKPPQKLIMTFKMNLAKPEF